MDPGILIMSFGSTKPEEIIDNIFEINGGDKIEKDLAGSGKTPVYQCGIKTKYYQNTVSLIPFEGNANEIPTEISKISEALIVFFDSQDRTFLKKLPSICSILNNNSNIELGLLLTNKLYDDATLGLTYKEVKNACNLQFDVIELYNEVEESDLNEHQGYDEVVHALHNCVWSNIICSKQSSTGQRSESNADLDTVEGQLEAFEDLLTNIQNFKKVSSTMEREEVLDQAEKLAELFANIINED